MARRPRIDLAGYHHIINRGVNRTNVFSSPEDKETFLKILCKACRIYEVIVHDYCLMDNHYHLLIENSKENLSLFMRQVNANYAIYFNKKEKRTGHLWQGRFSSWYILNDDYLYQTIRYIEYNPIEAGLSNSVGEYPDTLAAALFAKEEIPQCSQKSMLIKQYDLQTLSDFLCTSLSKEEIEDLEKEKRKKIGKEKNRVKQERSRELEGYFDPKMRKDERNLAVGEAFSDGYTQTSIANELGLTPAMVSYVIKNLRFDT